MTAKVPDLHTYIYMFILTVRPTCVYRLLLHVTISDLSYSFLQILESIFCMSCTMFHHDKTLQVHLLVLLLDIFRSEFHWILPYPWWYVLTYNVHGFLLLNDGAGACATIPFTIALCLYMYFNGTKWHVHRSGRNGVFLVIDHTVSHIIGLVCRRDEGVIMTRCMPFIHAWSGICGSMINGLGMMFVPCSFD